MNRKAKVPIFPRIRLVIRHRCTDQFRHLSNWPGKLIEMQQIALDMKEGRRRGSW